MTSSILETLQALPATLDYIPADRESVTEKISDEINDCFENMASNWQNGHYKTILDDANGLPLYCLCNIRICVYFLYSLWAITPSITTATIINTLSKVLTHPQKPWRAALEHKSAPALDKILTTSINLLFRKMLTRLDKNTVFTSTKQEDPKQALEAISVLSLQLEALQSTANEGLHSLLGSATKYFLHMQQEQQQQENRQQAPRAVTVKTNNISAEPKSAESTNALQKVDIEYPFTPNQTAPSYPLQQLFSHIQLLHSLVEQRQHLKAAVVLDDIQRELDDFNPLHYFPEHFASFTKLRAKHAIQLEPLFSQQDSYQWKVLHEHYKTDMQGFLDAGQETNNVHHASSSVGTSPYDSSLDSYTSSEHTEGLYDE
ncbi:type VI secretion system protein IglI family protein [Paraglaciecola marina]|uniref:type VI secretion system protein IglI family protein n=1 Tax=Paraglaciecola marina TaxID=2500157 RepID=UPI00105EDF8B|nr:type VI secretion system protein IglI family protein [Paraglaciecola marina]